MSSKQALIEWDKQYLWHPFTQMKEWFEEEIIIIERGEGIYLIDIDGKHYIDGISSMWTNVHGHRHQEIDGALKAQIDKVSHSTLLGYSNVPAIQLAKKLIEITPEGLNRVFFSDNGSTAVEIALKIAHQFWQHQGETHRDTFVSIDYAYHGDTIGAVSVGRIDLFHKIFQSLLFPSISVPSPYVYRSTISDDPTEVRDACLHKLECVLQSEADKISAVVAEPIVQGAGGMLIAPDGFLRGVADLSQKYGVLLILDEVMTGLGRTGRMWACEHENVAPDILCTAKGLTAGYLPLAATLTTDRIHDAFLGEYHEMKTFFHGHTFTGNQLGCVAALANLEIFERENLIEKIQPKITYFKNRLQTFYNLKHVGDIRTIGMVGAGELVHNKMTKEEFLPQLKIGIRVCKAALKRGVILRPLVNTIVIMPPLSITITELDQLLDTVYSAIREVLEA